ncbi:MAG: hypothetical protein P8Y26_01815 [Gemmatimonadales bacterium]
MKSPRSWLKSVLRAHGIAATYLVRAAGVLAGFLSLAAAVVLFLATQTEFGRNKALSYIQGALTGAFNGSVELGPVVGGNLLTRVNLERVRISGPDGELFVELDGVRLSYSPFGILRGRYTFRRLSADRLKLILRQHPEGDWNFDRIFGGGPDTIPEPRVQIPAPTPFPPPVPTLEPEGVRVAIVDGQVREGEVSMIWPWANDLTGEAYEEAVSAARRGETVWNVEPEGDGFVRAIRVTEMSGRFPLVRIAEPGRPFRIDLEEMSARIRAVSQPLDFRRFDGSMVFEDSIRFEVREAELGASQLTGRGWIASGDNTEAGEGTDFRFDLDGDPIGFADLQWLPIPIPREGGGPGQVVIRSQGGEAFVELRDAEVRVRDSRMNGGMVVGLGAMPRFDSLSVRFDPLRIALVDEILEREALIDGYLRGPLSGSGPMDAIDLVADLTAESLSGEAEPSRVRMAGKAGIVEPRLMSGLVLDLETFEPRWTAVVELPNRLEGRLDGRVVVDDLADDTVRVSADILHRTALGEVSRLEGGLQIHKPTRAVDLDAKLNPLELIALDMYIPRATLIGSVRGAIALSGRMDDLSAEADLLTPRGSLAFSGSFDVASERKTYDARLEASDIQLREWIEGGPSTDLAVSGRVRGEGTDPADAEATFDLAVLPSIVEGARIDTSLLRFSVRSGVAEVDTFAIRSELASIDGRGTFGLAADTSGTLLLDVSSNLSRFNRWPASDLMPDLPADASREVEEDLLADFAPSQTAVGEAADTTAGTLTGAGALFGNTGRPGIRLGLLIEEGSYRGYSADSLRGTVQVANLRSRDTLALDATVYGLAGGPIGSQPLDLLSVQLGRQGGDWTSFTGQAERLPAVSVVTEGEFRNDASGAQGGEEEEAVELEQTALRIRRLDVRVRERTYRLEQAARVVYGDSGLVVDELAFADGSGSRVTLDGEIPASGGADFRVEIAELPLAPVLELAPGNAHIDGLMRGTLRVRGTAEAPLIDARLVAEKPQLDSTSFALFTADLAYADRRLRGGLELMGEGRAAIRAEGEVRADLSFRSVEDRMPENAVDVNVRIEELPFALVRLINSDMTEVQGRLDGTIHVLGRPGGFRYEGGLDLSDGSAWMIPLQVRYTDMQGRVTFEGQNARIESLRLRSELGGEGVATGTLGVAAFSDPTFDLDLRLDGLRAIDKRELNFAVTGDGVLGGSGAPADRARATVLPVQPACGPGRGGRAGCLAPVSRHGRGAGRRDRHRHAPGRAGPADRRASQPRTRQLPLPPPGPPEQPRLQDSEWHGRVHWRVESEPAAGHSGYPPDPNGPRQAGHRGAAHGHDLQHGCHPHQRPASQRVGPDMLPDARRAVRSVRHGEPGGGHRPRSRPTGHARSLRVSAAAVLRRRSGAGPLSGANGRRRPAAILQRQLLRGRRGGGGELHRARRLLDRHSAARRKTARRIAGVVLRGRLDDGGALRKPLPTAVLGGVQPGDPAEPRPLRLPGVVLLTCRSDARFRESAHARTGAAQRTVADPTGVGPDASDG